jgi:hypothetical protein
LRDPILIKVILWHESSRAVVKFLEVMLDVLRRQILGRVGASALFHREDFVALFGAQTRHRRFVVGVAVTPVVPVAVASVAIATVTAAAPIAVAGVAVVDMATAAVTGLG